MASYAGPRVDSWGQQGGNSHSNALRLGGNGGRRTPVRRSASGTIHMENNGVYVSSDDSDDDFSVVKDSPRGDNMFYRSPRGTLSHHLPNISVPVAAVGPQQRTPSFSNGGSARMVHSSPNGLGNRQFEMGSSSEEEDADDGHLSDYSHTSASSIRSIASERSAAAAEATNTVRRRRRQAYGESMRGYVSSGENEDPINRSSPYGRGGFDHGDRSPYGYSPSSAAGIHAVGSNPSRSPASSSWGGDSLPRPSPSNHGYSPAASFSSPSSSPRSPLVRRRKSARRAVQECGGVDPRVEYTLPDDARETPHIEVYGAFGDPRGSIAIAANRTLFAAFAFAALYFLVIRGRWAVSLVLVLVGIPSCSFAADFLKLWLWKHASGMEPSTFQSLYDVAEAVCFHNIVERRGHTMVRQVCVGEVACALAQVQVRGMSKSSLLRFWVEACVHFRHTLRSGCQFLGTLRPKQLTAATLARASPRLPTEPCASCVNKTELETKFPVKFRD